MQAPDCKENDKMCEKRKDNRADMKEIFQQLDLTAEQQSAMKDNRKADACANERKKSTERC